MYQINAVNSGAYRAFNKITDFANEKPENTSIFDAAEKKAKKEDDKTAITIMLEDFSEKLTKTNEDDKSHLTKKDVELKFFDKVREFLGFLGCKIKDKNVFSQKESRKALKDRNYYQDDIYKEAISQDGGLKYAKEDGDMANSALNFAKADIEAVNKAYDCANNNNDKKSGTNVLDRNSLSTLMGWPSDTFMEGVDLDGDSDSISAEEYASAILAGDGILGEKDGLLTAEEVEAIKELKEGEFSEMVKNEYEENYAD